MIEFARELLEFLSRSENRVAVLIAVSSRPSIFHADLHQAIDVPRSNLNRIHREMEDREPDMRTGHRYEATPLGELLGGRLRLVVASVDSTQRLQRLLNQLSATDPETEFTGQSHSGTAIRWFIETGDADVRDGAEAVFDAHQRIEDPGLPTD